MKLELIQKELDKFNKGAKYPYTLDSFIHDSKRYIKAIKQGRMLCHIDTVSQSGMSRTIKFLECNGKNGRFNYLNFFSLFDFLGYQKAGKYGDYFRVYGCGMDMIFHTNYSIIHDFKNFGIINKNQCRELSQKTPCTI